MTRHKEPAMRKLLIAAASALISVPAAAQDHRDADALRGAADAIEQAAPAIDRATGALLDLDVGPIIDAARPYGSPYARHRRTLRQIARRDDPYFEQHLRASIYDATARASVTLDAIAAAEPALRRSLFEMERNIRDAIRGVPPYRARPGRPDEYWDRDGHREGPYDEPY
jgi:hypothetical protein